MVQNQYCMNTLRRAAECGRAEGGTASTIGGFSFHLAPETPLGWWQTEMKLIALNCDSMHRLQRFIHHLVEMI